MAKRKQYLAGVMPIKEGTQLVMPGTGLSQKEAVAGLQRLESTLKELQAHFGSAPLHALRCAQAPQLAASCKALATGLLNTVRQIKTLS